MHKSTTQKVEDTLKQGRPEIQWQDIKDFRNLLIHEYFGVDFEIVWNNIKDDLPGLINTAEELLQSQ
jgi:uncharacterized protein with HEPN domain